jgi:hypothetical protein
MQACPLELERLSTITDVRFLLHPCASLNCSLIIPAGGSCLNDRRISMKTMAHRTNCMQRAETLLRRLSQGRMIETSGVAGVDNGAQ